MDVESLVKSLDEFIKAGCCEPSLKTMERQIGALPWPADLTVQIHRTKLITSIKSAQAKARKDLEHC